MVTTYLTVSIDKARLIQKLGLEANARCILYIIGEKLTAALDHAGFEKLAELLVPHQEVAVLIFIGNGSGRAEGSCLRILGLDQWASTDCLVFLEQNRVAKRIQDMIAFRDGECHWGIASSSLTPMHLRVERTTLSQPDLLNVIAGMQDRLVVAYLADSTHFDGGAYKCEFKGFKRVQLVLPPLEQNGTSSSLYALFTWAYDNSSSDKLGIVRQVISLQLGDSLERNYSTLTERANEILSVARSNFQLFLQRNVELYFDKRLKVSEYLQKFSQDVGASVSAMGTELLGNLYKTIGVILGSVIATILGPDKAHSIIWLAALLYSFYIVVVLIYVSASSYLRFGNKVAEYKHSITQLRDVLSAEEIASLQGTSYDRARWTFLGSFFVAMLVYVCLGVAGLIIVQHL